MNPTIYSTHGTIITNPETGTIIATDIDMCNDNCIDNIDRFDIEEYKQFYNVDKLPGAIDILDMGYWKDGIYEEPAHDWREDTIKLRAGLTPDGWPEEPIKKPECVLISEPKDNYHSATIHIPNVNLHLFEKQRRAFLQYTTGIDSFQDERDGLKNFLNAIGDAFYNQTCGHSSLLPELNDVDDVKHWFEFLIEDLDISIHPDNPFEDYINNGEPGEPTFDAETAALLNKKMEQAFLICTCTGRDIYEIGMDITRKTLNLSIDE